MALRAMSFRWQMIAPGELMLNWAGPFHGFPVRIASGRSQAVMPARMRRSGAPDRSPDAREDSVRRGPGRGGHRKGDPHGSLPDRPPALI